MSIINSACKEATFNDRDKRLWTRHFLYIQAFGNTTPIFAGPGTRQLWISADLRSACPLTRLS